MKVNPPPWTDEEKRYMCERYPFDTIAALALALKRPMNGVRKKAVELGLRKDPATLSAIRKAGARRAWTVQERQSPRAGAADRRWTGPPPPSARDTGPEALAYRKRLQRDAARALIEHGVDEVAAELAADLILRGRVPGVRFEV